MKIRISNIDTLSSYYDRLICENIKLYFFKKEGLQDRIVHQEHTILKIKSRITELFVECLSEFGYDFLQEKRTFNIESMTEELEKLIRNDIEIGEADRARLAEISKPSPELDVLVSEEARLRFSNEGRAMNKNTIDEIFKNIVQ